MGNLGRGMCEGEYESLKAIHSVSSNFAPKPWAWGKCKKENPEAYFLLEEFRKIGGQVCKSMVLPFSDMSLTPDSPQTQPHLQQDLRIFTDARHRRTENSAFTSRHTTIESHRTWMNGMILGQLSLDGI